jgi:hypothetical protein
MTRRDFEIRAAEFFLCGDNIKEQYEELLTLDDNIYPDGNGKIIVWEPFEGYTVLQLLELIENLAYNYEEFYNMINE